ncbi:hypothetical protein FRC17_008125, partial [Serendipita sp. 399]
MVASNIPFDNANFTLDSSGVAGFFGGDEVISAMGTVHFYRGRRWLGWYNSPGSYTVAKTYGRLANGKFWNGLFPGGDTEPNGFLGLDGEIGPAFIATHSGTKMGKTGHIASLMWNECQSSKQAEMKESDLMTVKEPAAEVPKPTCAVVIANLPPLQVKPRLHRPWQSWIAALPIISSAAPAVACAYYRDWFCFSMIALGMFCSGVACLSVGLGSLSFVRPKPAEGSPPGDGVFHAGPDFMVVRGEEGSVNAITRGAFSLKLYGAPANNLIGACALLLIVQFFLQLLVIPQGSLFGQIMFLVTFGCSWVYNCWLSSIDKGELQTGILVEEVLGMKRSDFKRYAFLKRTTAVVFLMLVLQPREKEMLLDELLPNNTGVWRKWKEEILRQVDGTKAFSFPPNDLGDPLLDSLYEYAHNAFAMYKDYKDKL